MFFFLSFSNIMLPSFFFLSKIMLPSCSPCRVRPSQSRWPKSLTLSWVTDPRRKWRKRRSRPRRPSNATRRSWRSTTSHRPPGGRSRPRSVSLGQTIRFFFGFLKILFAQFRIHSSSIESIHLGETKSKHLGVVQVTVINL